MCTWRNETETEDFNQMKQNCQNKTVKHVPTRSELLK